MSSDSPIPASSPADQNRVKSVVIATTVALSFISLWRAAAIVLSDMASTMFYVGGLSEQAIGKSAPWFVLGVMLFSFAIRSIYLESCGMFVRGGVYVVVRQSMGPTMAKLSVSALVVDYILTGPISSVCAGQYLAGLVNEMCELLDIGWRLDTHLFAVFFGVSVTVYFWRSNIKGIHESSGKALRIMQITTVMVVTLLIWCPVTLWLRGNAELPPAPTLANLHFTAESLGWLDGTFWPQLAFAGLLIAFGHSVLAMSGFETLAQVYREIGFPKMRNLKIAANIVCTYAFLSTGLISLFAVMIIPDETRPSYFDNLIGGLSMSLAGPELMRVGFHIFVVVVGTLILSGAVNTSIIGANGILNRVAEDGVLLRAFRSPHKRFGTTHRIISLITVLQLATILASRGDVYLLGEAYAFGVVWSFFLKGLGVLALRFQRQDQEYKMPLNLRIGGVELPIGLGLTTGALFLIAIANLFTKKIATIYGISFTIVLFALFMVSEYVNARSRQREKQGLEKFNLEHEPTVEASLLDVRPQSILVAVRDYNHMQQLDEALERVDPERQDVIVMTIRPIPVGTGEYDLSDAQLFGDYEGELFSSVVTRAEKMGKSVKLLVVPAVDPFDAMTQTASRLEVSHLLTGASPRVAPEELSRLIGLAWEKLPEPRHQFFLEVIDADRKKYRAHLGPHRPALWPDDVILLHDLWLDLSREREMGGRLHHRDVVGLALRRLKRDLGGARHRQIVDDARRHLHDE